MKISFEHTAYEMTLSDGIRFRIIAAWFPFRRLLRTIKRAFLYLKTWISTLVLFLPICLIVYYLLLRFHIFERTGDAIVELVSILLGSVALLAIKEFRDSEVLRHWKLQQQWGSYTNCQYELTRALHNLATIAGIQFNSEYLVLSSSDTCRNAINSYSNISPSFDKNALHANLLKIKSAINSLMDEALRIGFIDWDYADVKNYRYKCIFETIEKIEHRLDASLTNILLSKNDVLSLAQQMMYFLAAARRPWRYRNDIARKKLLKRFLEEHGEPI